MFTPTAPAVIVSSMAVATSDGAGPRPASMSAVTGTSPTAFTMSATTSRATVQGICSPSWYPRVSATAKLLVAIAGAPASVKTRAEKRSQALTSRSG